MSSVDSEEIFLCEKSFWAKEKAKILGEAFIYESGGSNYITNGFYRYVKYLNKLLTQYKPEKEKFVIIN